MMLSVLKVRLDAEKVCCNDAEEADQGSKIGCKNSLLAGNFGVIINKYILICIH